MVNKGSCFCVLDLSILSFSMIFSNGFWNCSNSLVFFVFHFINILEILFQHCLIVHTLFFFFVALLLKLYYIV